MGSVKRKSNARTTSTKRAKAGRAAAPEFGVCIDNTQYPASLERHRIDRALSDPDAAVDGDLRILDESGEDYLYPADRFVPITPPEKVKASLHAVP